MTALLFLTLSRRLQPPCAALLILAAVQVSVAAASTPAPATAVRGALATSPQIAPERS